MNQINLDKLLQLAPAGKADSAALKLVIAQVYQAQVQQLSDGGFRLQLPTKQGPLQLPVPAAATAALQQWLLTAQAVTGKSGSIPAVMATPGSLMPPLAVQVQFMPQPDSRVLVTLQSSGAPITLTLQSAQVRPLILQLFINSTAATPSQTAEDNSSAALISARLVQQPTATAIQLPGLPALPVSAAATQSLAALLAGSQSNQLTVLLQLSNSGSSLSANVLLPAVTTSTGATALLDKPQQVQLLQHLVRQFNQQQLSSSDTQHTTLTQLKLPTAAGHHVQLQPLGNQWQLQLLPNKPSVQMLVQPDEFSHPLQFVSQPAKASSTATQPATAPILTAQTVQQAWRHLLPLLPSQPDPLLPLPELPEAVQHILQLVRHSQPDGAKVMPPNQLVPQLLSLLQFQPLQSQANIQTSGGALAVAIQLLLGHLLQKPTPAAQGAANQKLVQLVNSLEPAQAGNLLRQLASHSSTLQQSQLATLDNSTAQQQVLLQLPLQLGDSSVFSQIQLEQRDADGKQNSGKQTLWQLTMKFDLQQLGPLLVVAKLQQHQLQLQFYTELPQALALAQQFLPILKDRCKMQGLDVSQAECMLGKIPDSLLPRANSLLAIKV